MTSSELITDLNLTLLGDVNLRHLQHARRKVVTDCYGKLATAQLSVHLLRLAHIVDDKATDKTVYVLIVCPVVALNTIVFKILQCGDRELGTLRDDFGASVIFYAL